MLEDQSYTLSKTIRESKTICINEIENTALLSNTGFKLVVEVEGQLVPRVVEVQEVEVQMLHLGVRHPAGHNTPHIVVLAIL